MILMTMGKNHAVQAGRLVLRKHFRQRRVRGLVARINQKILILILQQHAVRLADIQANQPRRIRFRHASRQRKCAKAEQQRQQGQKSCPLFHVGFLLVGLLPEYIISQTPEKEKTENLHKRQPKKIVTFFRQPQM